MSTTIRHKPYFVSDPGMEVTFTIPDGADQEAAVEEARADARELMRRLCSDAWDTFHEQEELSNAEKQKQKEQMQRVENS